MASGGPPSLIEPPGTPPTPALHKTSSSPNDPSFQFVCDDFDQLNNNNNHNHVHNLDPNPGSDFRAPSPRSSPAAFLHPNHTHPSPKMSASEDGISIGNGSGSGNGAPADAPAPKNPFNFQTQVYSAGPAKPNIGQRRGHRYKHSSISATHQFFQEPPPRPPPVLPASLPIPTLREAWASMQRDQLARLWWCCCHAAVAVYLFFAAQGSLAMTALSHLVFFDVGSAAVCVAVEVLGNFEVWRRSSIRHPFGLQRAEVLAGFAMSVFLVFGGFDLISHNLKDLLEGVGHHAPHHPAADSEPSSSGHAGGGGGHSHGGVRFVAPGTIDLASLAAVISTLISAYGLRNHNRIRRVMRVPLPYLSDLLPGAGLLANPFHFLTLGFALLMLILPLIYITHLVWLDRLICAVIAGSMFVLGSRLAVAQGLMLLMSYSGQISSSPNTTSSALSEKKKTDGTIKDIGASNGSVSAVVREIEAEPQVARVEEAQFWQVHYGLAIANLKVCLTRGAGSDDGAVAQLRSRLARVVQNRLGEGYGKGGSLRWEVTIQMSLDQ